MTYLALALAALFAGLYFWERYDSTRRLDRERATAANRETKLLEKHAELVDRISLLKVDPQVAVAKVLDPGDDNLKGFTLYDSDEDFFESIKELDR